MHTCTYHLNCRNEYEFKIHSSHQSSQAFSIALEREEYPARHHLAAILFKKVVHIPNYLMNRISEIGSRLWNLLSLREEERKPFHAYQVLDLAGLFALQFTIPFACVAMRVCATVLGFMHPRWALEGWKIAEGGEEIFYRLWSQHEQEISYQLPKNQERVCAEIAPESAIFHLGLEKTFTYLAKTCDQQAELEATISDLFLGLLKRINHSYPEYLRELWGDDLKVDEDPAMALHRYERLKRKRLSYLSPDAKDILNNLKRAALLNAENQIGQKRSEQQLIEQAEANLSLKEMEKVFMNIYMNLHAAVLDKHLKLKAEDFSDITLLLDLFSQRFHFGRAHFFTSHHSLFPYSKI